MDLFEFPESGVFSFQSIFRSGSNVEKWLVLRDMGKSQVNCARFKKASGELLMCSDRSAI